MMKMKGMAILLSLVLAVCLLAGCAEEGATPTNISPTSTQQELNEEKAFQENAQENKQPQEEKQEEAASVVQEEQVESKVTSTPKKEDEEQTSTPTGNGTGNSDVHGDAKEPVPAGFTSVAGFHSWLQKGGIEEEVRGDLLKGANQLTTLTNTTYLRPKLRDGNQTFTLSEIQVEFYEVRYYYVAKDMPSERIRLHICTDPLYMRMDETDMAEEYRKINSTNRKFDQYGESVVNGITYYYYHYPSAGATRIYWKIDENTFYARYYGDYSKIKQILPLLELEQVGYKLSSGAVKEE